MKSKHVVSLGLFLFYCLITLVQMTETSSDSTNSALRHKKLKKHASVQGEIVKEKEKEKAVDYFTTIRKKNSEVAIWVMSCFLFGILLLASSVYVISWNERRAVQNADLLDFIKSEKKCEVIDASKKGISNEIGENVLNNSHDKAYIVLGQVEPIEDAKVKDVPGLSITSPLGNVVSIRLYFENPSLGKDMEDGKACRLIGGEGIWKEAQQCGKFETRFYDGSVKIGNDFLIYMPSLHQEINNYKPIQDNKDMIPVKVEEYHFTENDKKALQGYLEDDGRINLYFNRNEYIYIIRNYTMPPDESSFDPTTYVFHPDDLRLSIKYYLIKSSHKGSSIFTSTGKLSPTTSGLFEMSPLPTGLHISKWFSLFCCYSDKSSEFTISYFFPESKKRQNIIDTLEFSINNHIWVFRLAGFLVHFLSWYLILFPWTILIGELPYIGGFGTTVLIFFSFILSLCTFLFIIACAWLISRPLYVFLILGLITILLFIGKTTKEHMQAQEESSMGNNYFMGVKDWPKRTIIKKFL